MVTAITIKCINICVPKRGIDLNILYEYYHRRRTFGAQKNTNQRTTMAMDDGLRRWRQWRWSGGRNRAHAIGCSIYKL